MRIVDVTKSFFVDVLIRLSPPGRIWEQVTEHNDGSITALTAYVGALYRGVAAFWAALRNRGNVILAESRPSTATYTLPWWFREHGLPEPGFSTPASVTDQRAMLIAKRQAKRGQSRARMLRLADPFGVTAIIRTRMYPSRNGAWRYIVPGHVVMFRADISGADDPLTELTEIGAAIESQVRRAKPSHTHVEMYDDYEEV